MLAVFQHYKRCRRPKICTFDRNGLRPTPSKSQASAVLQFEGSWEKRRVRSSRHRPTKRPTTFALSSILRRTVHVMSQSPLYPAPQSERAPFRTAQQAPLECPSIFVFTTIQLSRFWGLALPPIKDKPCIPWSPAPDPWNMAL